MYVRLFFICTLLLTIVYLSGNATAALDFSSSIFYSGDVSFDLNKTYSIGDVLKTKISVANFEDFPIANAYLVIDVVQGCKESFYPSQASDCDNIFYEKIIKNVNLPANGYKEVPFSYALSKNLKAGTYRLDVFVLTDKTPIVGISYIHLPGRHKSFELTGNGSSYNLPKIIRTKTHLQNETGPIGVGVDPGSMVKGVVYILSEIETEAKLFVSVCEWDDTSCKSYDWKKTYPVSLKTGKNKVDITFKAPLEPDAYAVRFELKNLEGNTLSLYRSRIIVKGKTAKIRKLAVSKPFFKSGETGKVYVLVGTSPDHYTKPVIQNVKSEVILKDLNSGETVFESSKIIPKLSASENIILKAVQFEFTTQGDLRKFEVCSRVKSSENKIYDEYCYIVNSNNFVFGKNFTLSYTYVNQTLDTKICVADNSGMPVTADVELLLLRRDEDSLKEKTLKIEGCSNTKFSSVKNGVYDLLINDMEGRQFKFFLNLTQDVVERSESYESPAITSFEQLKIIFYGIFIIIIIGAIIYLIKNKTPSKVE
jgi:hypothetical protein